MPFKKFVLEIFRVVKRQVGGCSFFYRLCSSMSGGVPLQVRCFCVRTIKVLPVLAWARKGLIWISFIDCGGDQLMVESNVQQTWTFVLRAYVWLSKGIFYSCTCRYESPTP